MRNKLASSIAILLNYGAKWRLLYYIFYVLCLDFELSIVLDPELFNYGKDLNKFIQKVPGGQKGPILLRSIVGITSLDKQLVEAPKWIIYLVVLTLCGFYTLNMSALAFHVPFHLGQTPPFYRKLTQLIGTGFEFILYIASGLFLRSSLCRNRISPELMSL